MTRRQLRSLAFEIAAMPESTRLQRPRMGRVGKTVVVRWTIGAHGITVRCSPALITVDWWSPAAVVTERAGGREDLPDLLRRIVSQIFQDPALPDWEQSSPHPGDPHHDDQTQA